MTRKKMRIVAGAAAAAAMLAAGLTFGVSRRGEAQPATTRMERMNTVGTMLKQALGPRVRYLSGAWQNVVGISNRFAQLKAMGLKPGPAEIAGPSAVPRPALAFGVVSAPPNFSGPVQTRFSTFTTSETSTAWCGNNAVVAFNDTGSLLETGASLDTTIVGYSGSTNAGISFTDLGTPPTLTSTYGSTLLGDPVAKCTSQNDFYLSSIFVYCTDGGCDTGQDGVTVSASTDGGKTFSAPVYAVSEDFTQYVVDKDWMTVDVKNPSDIFVTFTADQISGLPSGCDGPLDFLSSIDIVTSTTGLAGFPATPVQVAVGACDETLEGSQVVVGPDGTVYVAWEKIGVDGSTREIDIASSTDGGSTFSSPVTVQTVQCAGDCFELQGMIRSNEFPSLAVSPKNKLFMAWNDGDNQVPDALAPITSGGVTSDYGFTDVELSTSSDGGMTWSTPVRVNRSPATNDTDHFEPTVAVGGGRVAVCFYDRRNDPLNFLIDRYCANSTNGGVSWTNSRITGSSFASVVNQDFELSTNYMGDYDAMAADALGLNTGFIDSFAVNNPGYPRVKANIF